MQIKENFLHIQLVHHAQKIPSTRPQLNTEADGWGNSPKSSAALKEQDLCQALIPTWTPELFPSSKTTNVTVFNSSQQLGKRGTVCF